MKFTNKLTALLLCLVLAVSLAACGGAAEVPAGDRTCTLGICCETILDNLDELTEGKTDLVPADGILLEATEVSFSEGESVFDILLREMQSRKIHMSFTTSPIYESAYIEAIGNLYEFDCGALSGWMYCVNGVYPDYGVSKYYPQEGDVIEFHYTCDLGRDLGQVWVEQK